MERLAAWAGGSRSRTRGVLSVFSGDHEGYAPCARRRGPACVSVGRTPRKRASRVVDDCPGESLVTDRRHATFLSLFL